MKTKKELKEQYKQQKFKMGVFQVRNTENDKIFIGSSTDLVAIWNRLRFQLNNGLHSNEELQADWLRLGEAQFAYEILSEIKQDDAQPTDYKREAEHLEKMFMEELQPFGANGYHTVK
ncbi:GIY-YIG nuclease family protein [Niabella sp.]|uniref:GIY-YIG nuclease family protein n=1 Tax=Niabella sp. TaxID=1962976 RepID=UPI0026321560|nr:GIY-YIG nuclease family protein [Niabella sp.]